MPTEFTSLWNRRWEKKLILNLYLEWMSYLTKLLHDSSLLDFQTVTSHPSSIERFWKTSHRCICPTWSWRTWASRVRRDAILFTSTCAGMLTRGAATGSPPMWTGFPFTTPFPAVSPFTPPTGYWWVMFKVCVCERRVLYVWGLTALTNENHFPELLHLLVSSHLQYITNLFLVCILYPGSTAI